MVKDDENIVNMATFRKKARDAEKRDAHTKKEAQASINRLRFGRTGVEKKLTKLFNAKDIEKLDAHRREPVKPGDTPPENEEK